MNQWDGSRLIDLKCANCGEMFKRFLSLKRPCCSAECGKEYRRKLRFERLKHFCEVCGKEFIPKHPKSPGYTCSKACMGISRRKWRVECGDYVRILLPDHPAASKQGYVLEHRLVMEKKLGRLLTPEEVVHHMDGDPKNNAEENLELLTDSQHKTIHANERARSTKGTFAK